MVALNLLDNGIGLETSSSSGAGPFSVYLYPDVHIEHVPGVVASKRPPAGRLDSSYPGQPLLLPPGLPTFPEGKRLDLLLHKLKSSAEKGSGDCYFGLL